MMERKLKIIIIILVILMVLIGVGGTALYLTTDFLKSDEVLFQKYIAQNVQNIIDVFDISNEEAYIDKLRDNDHNESINMELKYLENQDDEEEVYNIQGEGIVSPSKSSLYRKIDATYGEQELASIEMLKENDIYGFRLSNLVQQFVSVQNATIAYLVSSMGYDGQYFSEKMNLDNIDFSGLLTFSDEEIEQLITAYANAIFSEIDEKNYSSRRNVGITLNNGESVDTTAYILTITKNDWDNMYKRILNQTISNQIVLAKIDQIDAKIKEAGFNEPEGQSLKEKFVSKLQEIINSIEYRGADSREIEFTVYQMKGKTVRTSIKTETNEFLIDLDEKNGKTISLKASTTTNDEIITKLYSIGKGNSESGFTKNLKYNDDTTNLEINMTNEQTDMNGTTNITLNYSNEKITNLNVVADINTEITNTQTIPETFNENNNILINNYEGNNIIAIFENLKERFIASLEESQANINTKMLNNILLWIDEREQESLLEDQNNAEMQKQRFNNQFILYEGENLNYEHVQRLINVVGKNMSNYEVLDGNKIKIYIAKDSQNEQLASQIANVIIEDYTYNVTINYREDGWVDSIDISVYEEE